ncbi:MAG: hypothetical protein SFT94_01210 [Pseudanabaenaceae cyanobacterium bins.68]|nr:hypothetical protein [Pseudanabaenaceae cyanobacterium bins.68]
MEPLKYFYISPLIRLTLLLLYVALVLPLPFLGKLNDPGAWWWVLPLICGFMVIYGGLSQRVGINDQVITVNYPSWVVWGKHNWELAWQEVEALKPKTTGQGGLVYYLLTKAGQGYLLPMRVAGFARLVAAIEAATGIDTGDVKPLAQPWMYLILLVFSLLLLLTDAWTISMVWSRLP